jgi:hypothetical protein
MEIWLYLDFKGISQQQWDIVWGECHEMLKCFPVALGDRLSEKKWDAERNVWKTQLIHGEGDKKCLYVEMDMASLAFGGRFRLYRNISHYPVSKENMDILWISEDNIDGYADRCRIWENGTKGAPYSLAVLALGILLENRFPANCFMYGFEYTDEHISNMCAWLSGVMNENMSLPICNHPERLWKRLQPLYSSIDLTIRRFFFFFKTSARKCFEFLISQGQSEALQNELIREMSEYSSVSQWGVTDLLIPFLEATQDVEQVALLVKRVHEKNGKEEFSLEVLLDVLLSKGITNNPLHAETTKRWNETNDSLVTGIETFNRLFLRMGGLPNRIDYYIPADRLLEIFGCTEPANGVKFQKMIEEETQKCLENYKKLEQVTEEIAEKASKSEPFERSDSTAVLARWVKHRHLPFEDYIIQEVERQITSLPNPLKTSLDIAKQLGEAMKEFDKKHKKPYKKDTREEMLSEMSFFSETHNFALRETAWKAIDSEPDLDILTMLTIYSSMRIEDDYSWKWRQYILETPTLWPDMHDAFSDCQFFFFPELNCTSFSQLIAPLSLQ